jgi:hypothetical protein
MREFAFVVNDAAAVYGVLQVEYVQVTEGPAHTNGSSSS